MSRYREHDLEDEEGLIVTTQPIRRPVIKSKPTRKSSYESNVDVQRWLQEQALDDAERKAPFNPTFLASLRDGPWIISSLTHFYEQDLIADVVREVKSGKEATVYCCTADASAAVEYLAAKVYRPRMFRSLKNDAIYRQSRTQRDRHGKVQRSGYQQSGGKESEQGRAARVSSWIEYEFQTQQLLYQAGVAVPRPVAQEGNAVLMEYIGDVDGPAPLLREVRLTREEAPPLFAKLISNIELCLAHGRIHGDLSEYNILYWQGDVVLIDFAQAVDPHYNPEVFPLLVRDVERVCSYFARYGVVGDSYALASEMWARYMGIPS